MLFKKTLVLTKKPTKEELNYFIDKFIDKALTLSIAYDWLDGIEIIILF